MFTFPPDLKKPGSGGTRERWTAFAELAARDLVAVRLAEGDADARAILEELSGPRPTEDERWAVWAARPPAQRVTAEHRDDAWALTGTMPYCSGASTVTHALVVADAPDGVLLFAVPVSGPAVQPVPDTWPAVGMAGTVSLDVRFDDALAVSV